MLYIQSLFLISSIFFIYLCFVLYNFSNVLGYINFEIYPKVTSAFSVDFFITQIDGVSLVLIWLTSFVILLCFFYTMQVTGFALKKHCMLLIILQILLVSAFAVKNLLSFYILFESILIPMFILIGLGSRGRKFHANMLFFFFTFASSILLLFGIFFIFLKTGTLSFEQFKFVNLSLIDQRIVFWLFFLGFAAKIPLLPLHIWLPEAHVEAPTVGSVVLAAILLKLGGYGLFRVVLPLCHNVVFSEMALYVVPFIVLSIIFPALTAVRQIDLKKIVAYSSVVHMSFSLLGFFSMQQVGMEGFLFLMISHGLISAGLFFCVGMLYDRFHTRNLLYFGGLVQFMPLFSIFFFLLVFSNLSLPGTCNFIGEFLVLVSMYDTLNIVVMGLVFVGLFFTVLFCLILLYKVIFYQISGMLNYNLFDVTLVEFLILFLLVVYILMFGIMPDLLLQFIYL